MSDGIDSNSTGLLAGIQSAKGTDASVWQVQQKNAIGSLGAKISTVVRKPVSTLRQREKGGIVGVDSGVDFEMDMTRESLLFWLEPTLLTTKVSPLVFAPTSVNTTAYVVASDGALADGTLIYASGFAVDGNNGFKVVGAASTSTAIKTSGLAVETTTVPQHARVEVCGVQGAATDIVIASATTMTSTVLNFTTLGWTPGQFIFVGGAVGGALVFATAANRGLVRIVSVAANLVTFEKTETTFVADAGTGKTIQIFWGAFFRQVDVMDSEYNKAFIQFEEVLPDLDGTDTYQYPQDNIVNEMTIDIPVRDKATMKIALVGTDTPAATTSRKSGCSTALLPKLTAMINTSSDCLRLRVVKSSDESVLIGSDDGVESISLSIKNGVTTQNAIRHTGAWRINVGDSEIDLTIKAALATLEALLAPRNHDDIQMDFGFKNDDGAVMFDIPSASLGDGSLDRPSNAAVMQNLKIEANRSSVHDSTLMVSMFPYLPAL